ncbi:MAG: FG-GAP repeat protein [Phycisphaerales bacterium]|jgi:hypothetical protein|nr:FG-GAP repeat protein [Phycisphaerales bacterium]
MKILKNAVGVSLLAMSYSSMVVATEVHEFDPPTLVVDIDASNSGFAHGAAVAVADDVAVVGRPFDGDSGSVGGIVDVYRRIATDATLDSVPWQWVPWCRLQPASPLAGSRFGNAVAVDGTTVVVGAWSDDRAGINAGAAWIFELPESPQELLTSDVLLEPSSQLEGDYFGWDVTIAGDFIAVGAWGVDVHEPDDHAGAAWIFERQGGIFLETQQLTAGSDAESGDRFGMAVDMDDDVLLVGAPFRANESGSVYSFHRESGGWSQAQRIDSPEGDAGEHFGAAVCAVVNDSQSGEGGAGIGAPGDGELGPLAGAAWAIGYVGGGIFDLAETTKITVDGGGAWDQAGSSIAGVDIPTMNDEGGGAGGILLGVPGWRNPDSGEVEGAVFLKEFADDGFEDDSFRLDFVTAEGAGTGASVAVNYSLVDQWGFPTVTVVVGAPGRHGGFGAATLVDVPVDDSGEDCNNDGRFDPMEVLFEPDIYDCDGNGEHDACQLDHDSWLDCDSNGQIDSCQWSDDPALDCDGNGELDSCQIENDPAAFDCDEDGVLDSCTLASNPESDCDGNGELDSCQIENDPAAFDCDEDGVLDSCTIASNPEADCDGNGVLDVCEPSSNPIDVWWMTEQFADGVDLAGLGIRLSPTGNQSPPLWQLCTTQSGDVWLDPSSHIPLSLTDDDWELRSLPFTFNYANQDWTDVFVGSNGYLTFSVGDSTYTETLVAHFDRPRISGFFDDLDPSEGGEVLVGLGPSGSFVVTWQDVPQYMMPGTSNTVQVVLHPNGVVEMSWPSLTATTAIVGPSIGDGVPNDLVLADLSNAWDCEAKPISGGDCNENGLPDACEIGPVGEPLWGVEHFTGDFDLGYTQVRWSPTGLAQPPFWQVCSENMPTLPIDTVGHSQVLLYDDDSQSWPIGFSFPFMGVAHSTVNIGSNGYVDFSSEGDTAHETDLYTFFQESRIAGFMADLDPEAGGQVLAGNGPGGSFVITYQNVPLYYQTHDVDMQILLHPDGAIEMAWNAPIPVDGVVGISDGTGIPYGFSQADLSASGASCEFTQPFDDCNTNGILDGIEIALGCELDYDMDGIPDSCQGGWGQMSPTCYSDVTRDGVVDVRDLLRVLFAWGDVKFAGPNANCDLAPPKGDLRVDLADLLEVIVDMQEGCGQS